MISFAHALHCYTTAARLHGYAAALDQDYDTTLIHMLKQAASLLEDVWAQHQRAEQQKAEKELRAEHPEIFK